MKKRRGMTIMELLIASFMLIMLLVLVYRLFMPAIHAWLRVDADSQSQQNAVISMDRFLRKISATTPASIAIYGTPYVGISFLSFDAPEDPSAPMLTDDDLLDTEQKSNPLIWKKVVIIYNNSDTGELIMKEAAYPQSGQIKRLITSSYGKIVADDAYTPRRLSHHVLFLAFSQGHYPLLDVSVTTSNKDLRDERTTTTNFVVYPRN
ncbi:MAG: hypothetical protein M1269_08915 [Chloroflexi bacterium]|nr:hypothetical protein [Chloroflexota bacterium]